MRTWPKRLKCWTWPKKLECRTREPALRSRLKQILREFARKYDLFRLLKGPGWVLCERRRGRSRSTPINRPLSSGFVPFKTNKLQNISCSTSQIWRFKFSTQTRSKINMSYTVSWREPVSMWVLSWMCVSVYRECCVHVTKSRTISLTFYETLAKSIPLIPLHVPPKCIFQSHKIVNNYHQQRNIKSKITNLIRTLREPLWK